MSWSRPSVAGSTAWVAVVVLVHATAAFAQGRSGSAPGHTGQKPSVTHNPNHSSAASPATPETQTVYGGSWLDDASVLPAGMTWAAIGVTHWSFGSLHETDFPVVSVAHGATSRVHFGVSVPFYHAADDTGATANGVGQTCIFGKFALRRPSLLGDGVAVALTPVLIVSREPDETGQPHARASWAVPLAVQWQRGAFRTYVSGGYFSRGALFAGGAVALTIRRTSLTATIGHTYSTSDVTTSADAPSRHRTDLGGGVAVPLTKRLSVYGGLGRSFGGFTTPAFYVTGGISIVAGAR